MLIHCDQMKLGSKYDLLDNLSILKYKQITEVNICKVLNEINICTINHYLLDPIVCNWLS